VLCSPAERSFLGALEKVVGNGYQIFAKVRLADIVEVNQGLSSSARQSAFNRISRKHLDFVICNARDLSIVGAIEGGMGSSLLLTHDREKSIQHGNLYNTKSFKA